MNATHGAHVAASVEVFVAGEVGPNWRSRRHIDVRFRPTSATDSLSRQLRRGPTDAAATRPSGRRPV